MNRIMRERYPVEKLPDDLRELLDPSVPVTVVLEQATAIHDFGKTDQALQRHVRGESDSMPLTSIVEEIRNRRAFSDDPVTRVRALRAEWDRRDELHGRIRADDDG